MSDLELMKQQIAALIAENAALKSKPVTIRKNHIAVAPKGGVSVYGFARFPVTLYKEQWRKLIKELGNDILKFIDENESSLASKPVKDATSA